MDDAKRPEGITVAEYTGLLGLIQGMLSATETRILERLSDNSRIAAERWSKHDADAGRMMEDWERRFSALEARVDAHHHAAEADKIAWDARLGPVRNVLTLVAVHWRTIMLVGFGLVGMSAIVADLVARYLGVPT